MRRSRALHLAFSAASLISSALLWSVPTAAPASAATIVQSAACFSPVTSTWSTFPLSISAAPAPTSVGPGESITLGGTSLVVTVSSQLVAAGVGAGVVSPGTNSVASTVTVLMSGSGTTQGTQATTGTTNLSFDVTVDPVTSAVTVNPDPVQGTVPLGDTTWTAGNVDAVFAASSGTVPAGNIPTLVERNAAPIRILNKLNGALNANFYCWPGAANAAGTAMVAGGSTAIASVTVAGSGSSSSSSSSSSTSSSTTSSSSTSSTTTSTTSSTTSSSTTTTTVPTSPTTTGSASYTAKCTNSLTPDISELTLVLSGTVPTQVKAGDTVTLDDHTWQVTVPGTVLDTGIGLGLLEPGDTVEGSVTASVFASNTVEGTRSSAPLDVAFGPITADAVTGLADPATATLQVNGFTWTAVGGKIGYSMADAKVAVAIGAIDITFSCSPSDLNLTFVNSEVVGSTGQTPAGRTPTTPTVLGSTVRPQAPNQDELPRTGAELLAPVLLALGLLDVGYIAQSVVAPHRRRRPDRE